MYKVEVKLKNNPYPVYVGFKVLDRVGALLKTRTKGKRVLVVSNKKVFGLYGRKVTAGLKKFFDVSVYLMPDGEKYKNIDTLSGIYKACAKNGLDRHSTIVALGGGVVGDVAGFAAATYMRGINVVQVPTSLVAQVDSSVGGKTGVDLKEGKNLVGAFYQPLFVLADTSALKTLDKVEFENGMGEVIKHGIIKDKKYFDYIASNTARIKKKDKSALLHLVKRSVEIKADVVAKDEKEKTGLRAILNYGHTVGHAIESAGGYTTHKHGQAVAMGAVIAAKMAKTMGICSEKTVNEQIKVFNSFNLIKPLKNVKSSNIIKRLYSDKKVVNGKITFVLTKKIGSVILMESINTDIVRDEIKRYYI